MLSPKARLALVFLLALSLRWAYTSRFPSAARLVDVDASGYHQIAVNLLDGQGFSLNSEAPYIPDTLRTPAYPLFIAGVYALFGRSPLYVALAQGLMDVVTCLLLGSLVRRLTRVEWTALVASLLYALSPTAWRFCDSLLTEIPLAFVLTCIAVAFAHLVVPPAPGQVRLKASLVLGLLCGLALLIKPNLLLLPVLVSACLAVRAKAAWRVWLARAGTILASAALAVSPWVLRNWSLVGRPLFSSAFDDNLVHVSAVATLVHAQGEVVAPWTPRWEEIHGTIIAEAARRYRWSPGPPDSARAADVRQQQLAAVAREIIRQHPSDFALSHLEGFLRSWVPQEHRFWYESLSGQPWTSLGTAEGAAGQAFRLMLEGGVGAALRFVWQERFAKLPPLAFALWAGWIVATLLGAVLFWRGSRRLRDDPAFVWLVWSVVFYVTFLPGPISYVRFRVPVAPLIFALIAAGLVGWRQEKRTAA